MSEVGRRTAAPREAEMIQFTYNDVTYRTDTSTMDRVVVALTEALTSLDYALVSMILFLGIRSGRIEQVRVSA